MTGSVSSLERVIREGMSGVYVEMWRMSWRKGIPGRGEWPVQSPEVGKPSGIAA